MYVGITNNTTLRWKRHKWNANGKNPPKKHAIHYALSKYGFENFIFKEIETLPDSNSALKREIEWIKFLKQEKYKLYNETDGGEGASGYIYTQEQRRKISERNSGKGNPMYGVQLFGEANGNFGKGMKPHVKDILLKIRRKLSDDQVKEIISLFETGKHSQTSLSKQFNVCLSQIHCIVKGKSWGDKKHNTVLTKKNLTIDNVKKIREMYSSGKYKRRELAKIFNISTSHVGRIIRGTKWKNI